MNNHMDLFMGLPISSGNNPLSSSSYNSTDRDYGGSTVGSSSSSSDFLVGKTNSSSSSSTINGNSKATSSSSSNTSTTTTNQQQQQPLDNQTEFNTQLVKRLLKTSVDQKRLLEMIGKTISGDNAKIVLDKLTIMESESKRTPDNKNKRKHTSLSNTPTNSIGNLANSSSIESAVATAIPSSSSSTTTSAKESELPPPPTKKKKELPPIKNPDLFNEWKGKMEEVSKMELPTLEALDNLDELSESKKHIQINHKFLTQKKNNHTEQVRITYRNFFEKYPKLFYAFSYWTLNGKVKVIKEVFIHHPELLQKITEIPEQYKNFWKQETSEEN